MRLQYPINVKIVRVPCTGKVDVIHIMRAFEKGADGVAVIGCLEGECHFDSGNLRARQRVEQAQKILGTIFHRVKDRALRNMRPKSLKK
jgi:coenzyme F420-reducing hydrogenase delta subunit